MALRGLARYPALVLVLDRMEVNAPSTYAQVVRRAESIAAGEVPGPWWRSPNSRVLWQSSIARASPAPSTRPRPSRSSRSLAAVPLRGAGYEGGIARWTEEQLLPALAPLVDPIPRRRPPRRPLLGALAGDRVDPPLLAPFEWEGLWYRALPAVGERRRLEAIRERQGGNRVEAVLALSRATRASS